MASDLGIRVVLNFIRLFFLLKLIILLGNLEFWLWVWFELSFLL